MSALLSKRFVTSSAATMMSLAVACSISEGLPRDTCPDGPDCVVEDGALAGDGDADPLGDGDGDGDGGDGVPGDGDGGGGTMPHCLLGESCCEDLPRAALAEPGDGGRAVGRLERPDGLWCTATLISSDSVITAASCVEDIDDPRDLRLEPQHGFGSFGIPGRSSLRVSRVVQGRDAGDAEAYANWAFLTIKGMDYEAELGSDYRVMSLESLPEPPSPEEFHVVGYDEDLVGAHKPPIDRICDVLSPGQDGPSPETNCFVSAGGLGAPLFHEDGDGAHLVGVIGSTGGLETMACGSEPRAENLASGTWFAQAPLDAIGLAVLRHENGKLQVVAREASENKYVTRHQLNDGSFGPWELLFRSPATGTQTEGALRADGSPMLYSVNENGGFISWYWTDEETGEWSTQGGYGFPGPDPRFVGDFSLSNLGSAQAEIFTVVEGSWLQHRTLSDQDVVSSDPVTLESGGGYRTVASTEFLEEHYVIVMGDNVAFFLHGTVPDFSEPEPLDFEGNFAQVAAAAATMDRLVIAAIRESGALFIQVVDETGPRAVATKIADPPSRVGRFLELDAEVDGAGVVHFFALADDGNIYTMRGGASPASFPETWQRFYK